MSYGGGAKCGCCNKTVYMAEEVVAEGQKWHKMCFKCTDCAKMLDTTTVKTHDGKLYCKTCHTRSFGLKGYGYGGGAAGVLSTASQGSAEHSYGKPGSGGAPYTGPDGCPRCHTRVYAAEKIVGAGSSWHKACFNCVECHKKLDSTTMCDNEGEIYCKGCYGRNFGPKGVGFGQGAGALTRT